MARKVTTLERTAFHEAGHADSRREAIRGARNHVGANSDRQAAVVIGSYLAADPDEAAAYLKWRFVSAEVLIRNRWDEVKAVARELLVKTRITYADVRRVILEHRGALG